VLLYGGMALPNSYRSLNLKPNQIKRSLTVVCVDEDKKDQL